ncbi:Peroxisomal membrane protein PMP22 [Rhynchospora pubera]|uniref:Peroxisomal membrane protein PMP22 n=1 Tax=Rhynchospora pubera TaxID=906938 RepID=A0AAV8EDD6_9POAL|nr:Peroxisomal membrane protein PMP22 [Rhynchospora pubera]
MSDIASKAWAGYLKSLDRHPLPTKAVTAGVLTGISDAIAQKLSGNKHLQITRLLAMFLTGALYMGPFDHFLHKLLDRLFQGKKKETIAKKVFVQEFIISPMNTALFLAFYGKVVEGKSFSQVKDKVKTNLPSIQFASWRFWPFVAWFNYQFVPIKLRVLFMNIIGVGWGVFLNLKARSIAPKAA